MRSLLEQLQGLIERTYELSTGIDDIGAFVIGDAGLRALYADALLAPPGGGLEEERGPSELRLEPGRTAVIPAAGRGADSGVGSGAQAPPRALTARTLVRQEGEELRLTLYYPDALVEHLENHPPLRALDESNIDAFAVFVEELDHLLHIAHRRRAGLTLTLLELEWQANVTKAEVVRHLLAKRLAPRPLGESEERWVRFHLFDKHEFAEEDAETLARYREAARLARRTLDALAALEPPARLAALRAFARRSFADKLRWAGA
jgi:hypothetical protein